MPEDWIEATLAATFKWLQTTEDGLACAARLFHFEFERGMDNRQYELTYYEKCQSQDFCMNPDHCMPEGTTRRTRCLRELQPIVKPVKSSDVYFYRGCILEGEPVPLSAVTFEEKPKEKCAGAGCGITSHCLIKVKDAYSGTIYQCNHCVTHSDSWQVRSEGDPSKCETCNVLKCTHHPRRRH